MKIALVGICDSRGVIGRTYKPCFRCNRSGIVLRNEYETERCQDCDNGTLTASDTPWSSFPEHDAYVRDLIRDKTVIIGRNTFTSRIVDPVKSRDLRYSEVISVSNTLPHHGMNAWVCEDFKHAMDVARVTNKNDTVYVLGGAQLFTEALPHADEVHLTVISRQYEGDLRFPEGVSFAADLVQVGHYVNHDVNGPGSWYFRQQEPRKTSTEDLTFRLWQRVYYPV